MISEAQNGLREKKSTNTAAQTFIEDVQKSLDNNKLLVISILLDLTKAFDVINHKLLLAKLELYGLISYAHECLNMTWGGGGVHLTEVGNLSQFTEISIFVQNLHFLISLCSSYGGFLNASAKNQIAFTHQRNGRNANPAERNILYYGPMIGIALK
jgi:hypothetical protein